jgi:general L-amino acid transport system substrate-binding protein
MPVALFSFLVARHEPPDMSLIPRCRQVACILSVGFLGATPSMSFAAAGDVVQAVKARGYLNCGVSEGVAGFSMRDASGRWAGLDADFCRAVAAAVLGDPEKVRFAPLKSSNRFPALQSRRIDLLVRNTTWTLTREALLNVEFPAVLYYDGQGFMVPKSARAKAPADLRGAIICVEKGTTHEANLTEYFGARRLAVKPLVVDSAAGVAEAFFGGRCQAYTSDASQLAAARLHAPGGPESYVILTERISKEPLGPVVRNDDVQWVTLVRWVLFALITAEERGITRANIDAALQKPEGTYLLSAGGKSEWLARTLGVPGDWLVRAIKAGGNYGELFDRNLGDGSPLKLQRGLNRPWSQGGLHYAPPID